MIGILAIKGAKVFALLFAASLIYFALGPETDLMLLAKLLALSAGASIVFMVVYPQARGIKKGDTVVIMGGPFSMLFGLGARALSKAKIGDEIKVKLPGGGEAIGVVEAYEGLLSPPKVKLVYEVKK